MHKVTILAIIFLLIPVSIAIEGYDSPKNEFSISNEITIQDTAVYNTGYISEDAQEWEPFTFTGRQSRGQWEIGPATANPNLQNIRYVAAYSCNWQGEWNCGNTWQVYDREEQNTTQEPEDTTGLDSKEGDEQALENLFASTNGDLWQEDVGWSANDMDLSEPIYGVEVETINGELRVTEIDLRANTLTGSIDIQEWANLQELQLLNVMFNDLDTNFPEHIVHATNLEYLYLSGSDQTSPLIEYHPHEGAQTGGKGVHGGKSKGSEKNGIHGRIPENIDNLQNLKWLFLSWTDEFNQRDLIEANGISYIPQTIWNIDSLEGLYLYENWNIAKSGNTLEFPDSMAHLENLTHLVIGGGGGTRWDEYEQGFIVGEFPDDVGELTNMHQIALGGHAQLTELPNLSSSPELRWYTFGKAGFDDQPYPKWLGDGSQPKLDIVDLGSDVGDRHLAGPETIIQVGLTGELPEFGKTGLDLFSVRYSKLTGEVPVSFWTTKGSGIKKIHLGNNAFTGFGTEDLTHYQGDTFRLQWNNLSGRWPTFDWTIDNQFNRIRLEGNKFVFTDMLYVPNNAPNGETIFDLYNNNYRTAFVYKPQKPFGQADTITLNQEATINNFENVVTHPDNQYQWERNGQEIDGATQKEITTSQTGEYVLIVTNPGIPDLTLQSEPITIE